MSQAFEPLEFKGFNYPACRTHPDTRLTLACCFGFVHSDDSQSLARSRAARGTYLCG